MAFNSEKGFESFGFAQGFMSMESALDVGSFRLRTRPVKNGVEVAGTITTDAGEEAIPPFAVASEVPTLQHWTAHVARGLVRDASNFNRLLALCGNGFPDVLRDLCQMGLSYFDLIGVAGEDARTNPADRPVDPENPVERESRATVPSREEGTTENGKENTMPRESFNHAEIDEAFTLVVEQLGEERTRLFTAGSRAMQNQDAGETRRIMGLISSLDGFLEDVGAVATRWGRLKAQIDNGTDDDIQGDDEEKGVARSDDDGVIVSRTSGAARQKPFRVRLADGREISGDKMNEVFVETICRLGLERVAELNLILCGETLMTKDRSEIKKMPFLVKECDRGWIVKTQGNPFVLKHTLEEIGEKLDERIDVTVPPRNADKPSSPRRPSRPQPIPEGVRVGRIVKNLFPEAFRRGKVSEREFKRLVAKDSSRIFGTGGRQVLLEDDGRRTRDEYARYYSDVRIEHGGKRYLLTSQFVPESYGRVVAWLNQRGFTKREILEAGKGRTPGPTLFD